MRTHRIVTIWRDVPWGYVLYIDWHLYYAYRFWVLALLMFIAFNIGVITGVLCAG